jgi:hypothetical protein
MNVGDDDDDGIVCDRVLRLLQLSRVKPASVQRCSSERLALEGVGFEFARHCRRPGRRSVPWTQHLGWLCERND